MCDGTMIETPTMRNGNNERAWKTTTMDLTALREDAGAAALQSDRAPIPEYHDLRFTKPEVANCDLKWSGTKENWDNCSKAMDS